MNTKHIFLIILCMLLFKTSMAQVSVDPLTGAAGVNIPIYTIQSGQVSLPLSLSYNGSGVKPRDVEGTAGMGWQVNAGGQISRLVHGIPDDCGYDNASHSLLGWINSTAPSFINAFSIANDNNSGTCTDETTDISYITNYLAGVFIDTEPDIFYVNAPGLSCQLVYDKVHSKFVPITYQDIVISYTMVGGSGHNASLINAFTITNDKGVKYTFASPEYTTQQTFLAPSGTANYFSTKYQQYQYGVTYADSWQLTSITDPNGNGVILSYTSQPQRGSRDSVALYIGGSTTLSTQYFTVQSVTPALISSISTTNANYTTTCLTFNWTTLSGSTRTGQTVATSITGMGRNFTFNYSSGIYTPTGYNRFFLTSFTDPGCSTPINYQFNYIGESKVSGYTTALPDSGTRKVDYWGYYSTKPGATTSRIPSVYVIPSNSSYQRYAIKVPASASSSYSYTLTNVDNSADSTVVATGSLYRIVNVQGGITHINYESNNYLDVPSNTVVQGGGIRVRQVIDSVSTTSTNNIIRNYYYNNPSTGLSSGKPITLPAYAFTIPIGGTINSLAQATSTTALSAYDLSSEDHTIMYTNTKMVQSGAGYTTYQYYVPATNWDLNAAPACNGCSTPDWARTIDYVARTTCTGQTVNNGIDTYPFIPNPNYDFERGLIQKVTSYNDAGNEVSETSYTYQRSNSPSVITAFKSEDDNTIVYSVKTYNKYTINFNTSELQATVNHKIFDSANAGTSQSTTVNYTYGSANHKQVTQIQATNSDNSTVTTNISYIKDYTTAAAGTNVNVNAIYYLQQQNMNLPVESYQQVTRAGTTLTTGASLTLFKGNTFGATTLYLPSQQLKMVQPDGASFTPFTVNGSAQTITPDSKYFATANYDIYDNTGFPQTVDDNNKHIGTTIIDHYAGQPTAVFSNASANEIAFSDFDTDPTAPQTCAFSISGSQAFVPTSAHAGKAYGLGTGQTVSHMVIKNALAQNYIFSAWINTATAGTLSITLNGGTAHTLSYAGNGKWTYYEMSLSLSGLTSPLTVSFTSGQVIGIDDILFYPDVAEASTATYDAVGHYKIAATNTNGISSYFTNDQWGRMVFAFDQDGNIVRKNTFITATDANTYAAPVIAGGIGGGQVTNNVATGFSIVGPDACSAAGTTVTWNFGDGSSPVTASGLISPSHTFTGLGSTYSVSATINSPLFGTKTPTPVNMTVAPQTIHLSYTAFTDPSGGGDITSVAFFNTAQTVVLYSFTGTQLKTATIPQGNYSIHIGFSGGLHYPSTPGGTKGYASVRLSGDCYSSCANWVSTNAYVFSANLSNCTTLGFSAYQSVCP